MNLGEIFTPNVVAINWTETGSNRIPYLGEGLFPAKKKMGLNLSWIKGYKGLPVSLMPSNFDAKPTFRDRIGVTKIDSEMAFFREAMLIKEKDEQEIMNVQDSNSPYAAEVLSRIFDDTNTLIESALVVPERMRMQLLSSQGSPQITITANNLTYSYNYDPNEEFSTNNYLELTGTNKWSNTSNSNPMEDIRTAQDKIEEKTGVRPSIVIMSKKTFNYLLKNEKVKSGILAQNITANIFMTDGILKAFFKEQLGVSVVIYNKKFKTETGTTSNFYPDDMCALIPDGFLGSTWFGTTPEERTGMQSGMQVSIVNTGIAIAVSRPNTIPLKTETVASEIVLPSFERMDECFVMKVN